MNPQKITITILATLFASFGLADDFKTLNGKEYKDATVSRVEPDGIVIKFHGGIVKIFFVELPSETQKQYGYDPAAAMQQKGASGNEAKGTSGGFNVTSRVSIANRSVCSSRGLA